MFPILLCIAGVQHDGLPAPRARVVPEYSQATWPASQPHSQLKDPDEGSVEDRQAETDDRGRRREKNTDDDKRDQNTEEKQEKGRRGGRRRGEQVKRRRGEEARGEEGDHDPFRYIQVPRRQFSGSFFQDSNASTP